MEQIRTAYRVFNAESDLTFTVHPGPHVFSGRDFFPQLRTALGAISPTLPDDKSIVAWVRFDDGPESLDGTPYYWLGRHALSLVLDVPPKPGDALELAWGAKGDQREAILLVNGHQLTVRDGGHWGFRWIRVPLPSSVQGQSYIIEMKQGQPLPAFLSEIRLTSAGGDPNRPELTEPNHRGKLTLRMP
jgi:hypothetical protein